MLKTFYCSKNSDVENYLKTKAVEHQKRDHTRTYLIIDIDKSSSEKIVIIAYFSISLKILNLNAEVSASARKNLHGYSKKAERICVYLIGQIGKNDIDKKESDINMQEILDYAYLVIDDIYERIGGRIILVECEEIQKLIELYEKNGFMLLQKQNEFNQMIRFISD